VDGDERRIHLVEAAHPRAARLRNMLEATKFRAANYHFLGHTSGRGKYNKTHKQLTSIKAMYGLPLVKDFRKRLCS